MGGHPAEHHQGVLLHRPGHPLSGHHLQSPVVGLVVCRQSFLWLYKNTPQRKPSDVGLSFSYLHSLPFLFLRGALATSFLALFLFCPFPPTTCWFLDEGSISSCYGDTTAGNHAKLHLKTRNKTLTAVKLKRPKISFTLMKKKLCDIISSTISNRLLV